MIRNQFQLLLSYLNPRKRWTGPLGLSRHGCLVSCEAEQGRSSRRVCVRLVSYNDCNKVIVYGLWLTLSYSISLSSRGEEAFEKARPRYLDLWMSQL